MYSFNHIWRIQQSFYKIFLTKYRTFKLLFVVLAKEIDPCGLLIVLIRFYPLLIKSFRFSFRFPWCIDSFLCLLRLSFSRSTSPRAVFFLVLRSVDASCSLRRLEEFLDIRLFRFFPDRRSSALQNLQAWYRFFTHLMVMRATESNLLLC